MEKRYASLQVQGWGAFKFKEKLKMLKKELRRWNKEKYGNLENESKKIVENIAALDIKDEQVGLSNQEADQRKQLFREFWKVSRKHEYLLRQKSRIK